MFEREAFIIVLADVLMINRLILIMKYYAVLSAFIATLAVNCLADVPDFPPEKIVEEGCASVVCNNVIEPDSVNKAGDFPAREGNETLSAVGSLLFFAGEIGLAENLQQEEPENLSRE